MCEGVFLPKISSASMLLERGKGMSGLMKIIGMSVFVLAVMSHSYAAGATGGVQSEPAAQTRLATPAQDVKAAEEVRNRLAETLRIYEQQAAKVAEKNGKLKELYSHGDISRNEMEAGDKALAEARARVEDTRAQLKEAEVAIEAAKNTSVETPSSTAAEIYITSKGNEPSWTTGNKQTDSLIKLYGGKYGVDPYLIFCVMQQESSFRATATSTDGAQGLMQLMPATAARFGVTNSYDPAQNISAGARYLKFLLDLFDGRVDLALAGYNAGEGAVQKYGNRVPPYAETQNYVRVIGTRYTQGGGSLTLTSKTLSRKG